MEQTNQGIDLDELVSGLLTDKGKEKAIVSAALNRKDIEPKHVNLAIKILSKEKDYRRAAKIAEDTGDWKRAIRIYKIAGPCYRHSLADFYKRIGKTRRANSIYKRLISQNLKDNYYSSALRLAKEMEDDERIGIIKRKWLKHLTKTGEYHEALELARELKDVEAERNIHTAHINKCLDLGRQYQSSSYYESAINLAIEIDDNALAKELSDEASNMLLQKIANNSCFPLHSFSDYIGLCERFPELVNQENAAKVVEILDIPDNELHEDMMRLAKIAGSIEIEKRHSRELMIQYEEDGCFTAAAEIAKKIGEHELAKTYTTLADYVTTKTR